MGKGLNPVKSSREVYEPEVLHGELEDPSFGSKKEQEPEKMTKLQVVDNHFTEVANLFKDYLEIKKTEAKTAQTVAIMEEKRKQILAEAESYVSKTNADTRKITEPMDKVMSLLQELQSNKVMDGEQMKECIIALFDKALK